jgi:hypothetical protein
MPISTLTERLVKGTPLTAQEGDTNWDVISAFVDALESRLDAEHASDGTFKQPLVVRGDSSGSSNPNPTYAVTVDGTFAALTDFVGHFIIVEPDVTNVGASNLTLNGFTGNIYLMSGQELSSGEMVATYQYVLVTDGTNFFLLNPSRTRGNNFATTTNGGTVNDHLINNPTGQFEIPETMYTGYRLTFKAGMTSSLSAAVRLKISNASPTIDLGWITIKNGAQDLLPNLIVSGGIYTVVYDGTYFQLQTPASLVYRSTGIAVPSTNGNLASALTHGLGAVPDEMQWFLVSNGTASVAHGYASGDKIPVSAVIDSTGPGECLVPQASATTLQMACNTTSATMKIKPKGGGAGVAITGAQITSDFTLSVIAKRYVQ